MQRLISQIILGSLVVGQLIAQVGKLTPVDDATRDSSLSRFRSQLINALVEYDTTFLWQTIDSTVFGGVNLYGLDDISEFKRCLRYENGYFHRGLLRVLTLGGTLSPDGTEFHAPYTASQWPPQFEIPGHGVVSGTRVNVRSAANPRSSIVRQLSHEIVASEGSFVDSLGNTWIQIRMADSTLGFVSSKYYFSPAIGSVILRKHVEGWRIARWINYDP